MTYLPIKKWSTEDRPREKLLENGAKFLTDAELLAILLGSGTRELSALELAKLILSNSGNNLEKLGKCSVSELKKIKGVGDAKAISILASLELGDRRTFAIAEPMPKISSSQEALKIFQQKLSGLQHEEFWVAYLNRSNKLIETRKISQGGVSGTVIDNKLILKSGLELLASSLILCHNHPSGNIQPSKEDREITRKLAEAARMMEMQVLDHIIVGVKSYFSFMDEGLI